MIRFMLLGLIVFTMVSCTSADEVATETSSVEDTTSNVEIYLIDRLNGNYSEYCLDIVGGNEEAEPADGLQSHTWYSHLGGLGADQSFDPDQFAENRLYLMEFDICVQVNSLTAGALISLVKCDGGALQTIEFGKDGTMRLLSAPELCITASIGSRRGFVFWIDQIRDLSLQPCTDELAPYQQWATRTPVNKDRSVWGRILN